MFPFVVSLKHRWILGTAFPVAIILLVASLGLLKRNDSRDALRAKAKEILADSRSQANAALANRLRDVRAVFERARGGADALAEDALSWSGKLALIKGKLGIGEDDAHAAFLAETFSKRIFTSDDLKTALEAAVKGYLSDLDAIENQMLVRLRADLADSELGRGGKIPSLASDTAFQEEYLRLAGGITQTLERDAGMEVGRQVAGFVVMDVSTPIVIRIVEFVAAELGVEAGILGAGAASGTVTFGVGLIVGIVADQIISWVLKEAGYDPAAEIAGKIRGTLDRVEALLIDGTPEKDGLCRELERIGEARSKCQDTVIDKLLSEGGK